MTPKKKRKEMERAGAAARQHEKAQVEAVHPFRQCRLGRGKAQQVAWIPEEFAVVGRFLRLTEKAVSEGQVVEISEDGWQVRSVGSRLTGDYVCLGELGR